MTRRGSDPKLRELARQLGIDSRGDCAQLLREYAVARVRQWLESLPVNSTDRLLNLVAGLLSLRIVFLRDDADMRETASRLVTAWPRLEAQLRAEFVSADTLGLLLAHPAPELGAHRYYAFIDARGERAFQAYFTAWHEVAHLLLQPPQFSFAGFRRLTVSLGDSKDPLESLVDQVAGELAFFAPFAGPKLEKELDEVGLLTLDGISRIRSAVAPEGSFSSAAHALVRLTPRPAAFVVADLRLKPSEVRHSANAQLALIENGTAPEPKLRAVSVFPNDAAKAAGFKIFRSMRVPGSSVIADAYMGQLEACVVRHENQQDWESGGVHLPHLPLRVEAARFGPVVYSLITIGRRKGVA